MCCCGLEVVLSPCYLLPKKGLCGLNASLLIFQESIQEGRPLAHKSPSWQSVPLLLSATDAAGAGARACLTGSPPSCLQAVPSRQAALLLWDFLHVRRAVLRAR